MNQIFILTKTDKAVYNCYGEPPPRTVIVGYSVHIDQCRKWKANSNRDMIYDFEVVKEFLFPDSED